MQKANFKFDYSVSFLTSFVPQKKWWQLSKTLKLDLPALDDQSISHAVNKASLTNLFQEMEVAYLNKQFLESNHGRTFVSAYIAQFNNLSEENRTKIKRFASDFIHYSLDLIIENPASHANIVTLDAFELYGTTELLHTTRALKNAQTSGKKLVLVDDSADNFTEEYVYLADYWHIDKDSIEMRYTDWEAEEEADAEKVHTATFDSKPFVLQFNNVAHDIADLISKICRALQISTQELEKST
jgi:hypothetical protein